MAALGFPSLASHFSPQDARLVWPQGSFRSAAQSLPSQPSQPRDIAPPQPSPQSTVQFTDDVERAEELEEDDVVVALRSTSFRSIATVTLTPHAASYEEGPIAKFKVRSTRPLLLAMVTNADESEEAVVDAADHFFVVVGPRGGEADDGVGANETLVHLHAKPHDSDFLFSHLVNTEAFRFNVVAASS